MHTQYINIYNHAYESSIQLYVYMHETHQRFYLNEWYFQDAEFAPKTSSFLRNELQLGGMRSVQEMNGSRMKIGGKPFISSETSGG